VRRYYIELTAAEYSYVARCVLARPRVEPESSDATKDGACDAVLRALDDPERFIASDTMEEVEVATFQDELPADAVAERDAQPWHDWTNEDVAAEMALWPQEGGGA
jgi:hypothetical protein